MNHDPMERDRGPSWRVGTPPTPGARSRPTCLSLTFGLILFALMLFACILMLVFFVSQAHASLLPAVAPDQAPPVACGGDSLPATAEAGVSLGIGLRASFRGNRRADACVLDRAGRGFPTRNHVLAGYAKANGTNNLRGALDADRLPTPNPSAAQGCPDVFPTTHPPGENLLDHDFWLPSM